MTVSTSFKSTVGKALLGAAALTAFGALAAYAQDARLMPDDWQARLPQRDPSRARVIADFIAGMSDRFAMQAVSKIYGERPLGLINV